jgi:hypothetical protein
VVKNLDNLSQAEPSLIITINDDVPYNQKGGRVSCSWAPVRVVTDYLPIIDLIITPTPSVFVPPHPLSSSPLTKTEGVGVMKDEEKKVVETETFKTPSGSPGVWLVVKD